MLENRNLQTLKQNFHIPAVSEAKLSQPTSKIKLHKSHYHKGQGSLSIK